MKKMAIIFFLLCGLLQGCAVAVLGGTALTGVAVHNHRGIATRYQDEQIINLSHKKIDEDAAHNPEHQLLLSNSRVIVTSFDRSVLVLGQVPSQAYKDYISYLINKVPDIRKFHNQLTIGKPSLISERTMDSWTTTKVRTQLLATKGLASTNLKIITERQEVYLVGRISREQAALAVDAARRVDGVRKVITAFDYLNDKNAVG